MKSSTRLAYAPVEVLAWQFHVHPRERDAVAAPRADAVLVGIDVVHPRRDADTSPSRRRRTRSWAPSVTFTPSLPCVTTVSFPIRPGAARAEADAFLDDLLVDRDRHRVEVDRAVQYQHAGGTRVCGGAGCWLSHWFAL